MRAGGEIAASGEEGEAESDGGEQQLDDDVCGEDGLRAQRSGTETLEDSALSVDGDDGDEREHGTDGDENGDDDGKVGACESAECGRGCGRTEAGEAGEHDVEDDGDADGAECAHGLAQEDLDFNPRQFEEATEHISEVLFANGAAGEFEEDIFEVGEDGTEIRDADVVIGEAGDDGGNEVVAAASDGELVAGGLDGLDVGDGAKRGRVGGV